MILLKKTANILLALTMSTLQGPLESLGWLIKRIHEKPCAAVHRAFFIEIKGLFDKKQKVFYCCFVLYLSFFSYIYR